MYMKGKKISRCSEFSFVLGTVLLALGTVLQAKAGLGMSAAVAPAYVLSEAVGFIAPGTMCYIWHGLLVLLTFALLRQFKLDFIVTFVSAVIFGMFVNLFTGIVFTSLSDPTLVQRWLILALGSVLTSLALAFLFNSYFPPQAPELFAKEAAAMLGWSTYMGKYAFDICSCILSAAMSFIFFHRLRMIGPATVVCALVIGPMIGFFGRILNMFVDFSPLFPRIAVFFVDRNGKNN